MIMNITPINEGISINLFWISFKPRLVVLKKYNADMMLELLFHLAERSSRKAYENRKSDRGCYGVLVFFQ
jgi:hypothetical protein